ncbi:MAG: hypothetical protein ACI311_00105 [Bacilli bacterium]
MKKFCLLLSSLLLISCGGESQYDYELFKDVTNYMVSSSFVYLDYNNELFDIKGTYKEENDKYLITLELYNPVNNYEDIRLVAMSYEMSDINSNEYACMGFKKTNLINFTLEDNEEKENRNKLSLYWYSSQEELHYAKIYFSFLKDGHRNGYYIRQSLIKEI